MTIKTAQSLCIGISSSAKRPCDTIKLVRSKLIILTLFFLFGVRSASAGEAPILLNPANDSTVSSSSLNWQTPAYPVCLNNNAYRVQVDDDPSFPSSSIYRNIYTKNTSYAPQLTLGTWYWRVMARDETCNNWSNWSTVWSFTLTTSTPTPIPTQTPISTPSPTPSSSTQSTSSFLVSNIPSQINSDQSFNVSVNLSLPDNPNTNFYLKGAFKKPDSSNYFGLTKVSDSWVKNGSSYSSQNQITADNSGSWSGNLEVKPDSDDSGFTGSREYIFKVGRYTSSGSGPTWSNESTIKIISTENSQGETSTTTPTPKANPSTSPSAKTKTTSPQSKSYDTLVYHSASVAGVKASASASASALPEVSVKNQKQINPIIWVGLVFILIGAGSIGYIYLRKNGKIPF